MAGRKYRPSVETCCTLSGVNPSDLIRTASAAAQGLSLDLSGKSFQKLAREFVNALAEVPDLPAAEFTAVEIEQLSSTADHVIAMIERRIEAATDRPALQQDLASTIYDIRRRLEEISRWRRHFLHSPR